MRAAIVMMWSFLAVAMLQSPAGQAQVVAKADLDRLIGVFDYQDSSWLANVDRTRFENRAARTSDSVDVSHFVRWFVDTTDQPITKVAWSLVNRPATRLVTYIDPHEQSGDLQYQVDGKVERLSYYIMTDAVGFELQHNVLTLWRVVGDSLEFVCAQSGHFESSIGRAMIKHVATFPDNSILLFVEAAGGDGGDCWGRYTFLRGESLCDFAPFYLKDWWRDGSRPGGVETHIYASKLWDEPFKLNEFVEYYSPDSTGFDPRIGEIGAHQDSSKANIVDLWQIAVDSFHIDTTGIPEK